MSDAIEILLVEDNQNDIELTLHAFHKGNIGNAIQVVRDGEEALDFIFCRGAYSDRDFGKPPKVVLLDLKLPKVDGMQVLQQMKSDPRTKAIPVVILTSSREDRDTVIGYRLGVNSHIQKPVDFNQIRDAVKQMWLCRLVVNVPPPLATFRGE